MRLCRNNRILMRFTMFRNKSIILSHLKILSKSKHGENDITQSLKYSLNHNDWLQLKIQEDKDQNIYNKT